MHTYAHTQHTHRPIDFLPVEYAGVRGIDQKMYKEQESLNLKSEKDIYTTYRTYYTSLPTHDTLPGYGWPHPLLCDVICEDSSLEW